MAAVVSELIVSMDNKAKATKSPGYYGYAGPELNAYLASNNDKPHRKLVGRKTYEMLNSLPEKERDDSWRASTRQPGFLFTRTLKKCEWPGLEIVHDDMVDVVKKLKRDSGPELRVLGSLSIMKQLADARLLDAVRLMMCPVIVPETGREDIFEGFKDTAFELASHRVLDGRVLVLEYRPAGEPPRS